MKDSLRALVPRSPWCAAVAAWCGLAILVADAALLAIRLGVSLWRKIEVWRLLHGLDPLVSLESARDAALPYATATISFSAVSAAALLALAFLGVSHALRILAPLRVPEAGPPKPRGGAVALAAALGAALALLSARSAVGLILEMAAGFPEAGGEIFVPGFVRAQTLLAGVESVAVALGLAALPFCLLRLSGRRFAAPPPGSPEEADARRAEAWLSIALAGGAAAFAGDAAWMLLGRLAHPFHGLSFAEHLLSFGVVFAEPLLALCAIGAVRDALRRLLAEGALPDAPGGRNDALAAVVAAAAVGLVFAVAFAFRSNTDWGQSRALLLSVFAATCLLLAQLVLCAALVRRLPVPPGAQPAPPPPAFAAPARAWTGLALGLAALACAALEAYDVAAAALAAAAALCLGQRRAHPRAAWAGLAAAALAAFLLFRNDLLRAPWGFLDRGPPFGPPSTEELLWGDAENAEDAESESHARHRP